MLPRSALVLAAMLTALSCAKPGNVDFSPTGFAKAFNGQDWVVEDPFTDSTKFYMKPSLISHTYPYADARQALARSLKSEQQVFFVAGADPELGRRLEKKLDEWKNHRVDGFPEHLRSSDGVELSYRVYHVPPGLAAGEELLLEAAFLEEDAGFVIFDAGLSYGRPPDASMFELRPRAQPLAHATLPQLIPVLKLRDLIDG